MNYEYFLLDICGEGVSLYIWVRWLSTPLPSYAPDINIFYMKFLKILLENAYFAVIPPDEQTLASAALTAPPRLPPMYEFVQLQLATEIRVSTFRRLNWDDRDLAG